MAASEIGDDGTVSSRRRFDDRDFRYIAEYVIEEYTRRKKAREAREKHWREIDRQVEMVPDIAHKSLGTGVPDPSRSWMAELELPLQAQALEVLTADARRFMKPDTGLWFKAHAETTDDYLKRVNFQSLVLGDETEVPSHINQDNADKLVEGFLAHNMAQYDFWSRIDRINAEAFKYGMGVGRVRMENKTVYMDEARGVRTEQKRIPVLVPCSIKNLYLDDAEVSMHSAQVLGPAHIWRDYTKYANLATAANKGSDDPNRDDGGWMPAQLKKIEPDDKGYVTLLEMEGDIVVPRKTVRSVVLAGAIVTVAMGGKDNGSDNSTRAVVRLRWRKTKYSTYIPFPYHYEDAEAVYPASPLMKGRPMQVIATQAANRALDSGMLKIGPPVGYDRSDAYFASTGGPKIHPFALWGTSDPQAMKAFVEVGGDPSVMLNMMNSAVSMYAELTGVLPARLGAQTVSHTTAYAKGAELQQGAVRTVDYVNQVGGGAMVKWLDVSYQMARDDMKEPVSFYIADYGGFVQIDKDHLPDNASFDWLGSGGPKDQNDAMQAKVNSLLLAQKLDSINLSTQQPPHLNINGAIDAVLREGGWLDLDTITNHSAGAAPGAGLGPGPAVAALQNLANPQPE